VTTSVFGESGSVPPLMMAKPPNAMQTPAVRVPVERCSWVHFDDYGRFHSPISTFVEEVRVRRRAPRIHLLQRGEFLKL
jgi:hypothetical protein